MCVQTLLRSKMNVIMTSGGNNRDAYFVVCISSFAILANNPNRFGAIKNRYLHSIDRIFAYPSRIDVNDNDQPNTWPINKLYRVFRFIMIMTLTLISKTSATHEPNILAKQESWLQQIEGFFRERIRVDDWMKVFFLLTCCYSKYNHCPDPCFQLTVTCIGAKLSTVYNFTGNFLTNLVDFQQIMIINNWHYTAGFQSLVQNYTICRASEWEDWHSISLPQEISSKVIRINDKSATHMQLNSAPNSQM